VKNLHSDFSLKTSALRTLKLTLWGMKLRALEQIHTKLLQSFAGWPERVTGEPLSPGELASMLPQSPAQLLNCTDPERVVSLTELLQVATAWERADCFVWAARSLKSHRNWDPLVQSWADFEAYDPDCLPFMLGLEPVCPQATIERLLGFMVTQELLQPSIDMERQ